MIIFTSVCANYVHKARTLAQSVKANIPDARMVLCLVEREIFPDIIAPCFDSIVLAKDAWEGNFNRFIFKHTIVEASTAVKGQFFRYLYDKFPEENYFIYLDPDVYVYSDLIELKEVLTEYPIVLCPHLLKPGNIDMELSSTAHGVFNLGFLAISRSEEGKKCIDWWAERLYLFCYDDIQKGIFTDQKWFDLAPCFFNVKILKHHGYDFAPWSLLGCDMSETSTGYIIEGDPLRFIHFSGFGESAENCMKNWLPEGNHPFRNLYSDYAQIHNFNDMDGISTSKWSYLFYESGEVVEEAVRYAYRDNYEVMFLEENPFVKSNLYYKQILNKQNGLITLLKRKSILEKSKKILHEEGLMMFIKKIINKITRK